MFRRWAEGRMYRNTVQIAVSELRRAARASHPLEKLRALEAAEQKLKDALWLCPEESKERFEAGLTEIPRSRARVLREGAVPAAGRLLEAAEKQVAGSGPMLEAAGELLSLLNHYLPEDQEVEELSARFLRLGGKQPPYRPPQPLWELYQRPPAGPGCAGLVGGLIALAAICWMVLC